MNDQDFDKLMIESIDELPREMSPTRDLWSGIEHAIEIRESGRNSAKKRYISAAAVLAVVIGAGFVFTSNFGANEGLEEEIILAAIVQDMDRGFAMRKASMLAGYEGRASMTSNWRDQLKELEDARDGIWVALEEDPNNVYLIQILQNIQDQQLDLIERVHTRVNRSI